MLCFFLISLLSIETWKIVASGEDSIQAAHMKPFGAHMPPEAVDEYPEGEFPTPQDFWTKHVKQRKPVVLRGASKSSPSFEKWTDEYLEERYGGLEVRIEARKEKQGYIPIGDVGVGRDTIGNFVKTYHQANKYIVSELPRPMYDDVEVIPCMSCGDFRRRIVEVDWWMNGGNASSIIHKDAFNQINCLMNGTKEWKLIEYKYEKSLYKAWEPEREVGGYSRVNPERVDLHRYPKVATVPWMFTTLQGGDCLYLPGSMYHQVKSYGTNNFAVSLLFSRFDGISKLDFSDCHVDDSLKPMHRKLGGFDVDWQYKGTGAMTMGEPELELIRQELYLIAQIKGSFSKALAQVLLKEVYSDQDDQWLLTKAKEVVIKLENITGTKLSKKTIRSMPKEALRVVALALQPIDPSNTYNHEYTYVSPDNIRELLKNMLRVSVKITREDFVKRYQNELFGTAKFAEECFSNIAGESVNEASKEQVERNMQRALEKYEMYQRSDPEPPQGEVVHGDAYDETNEDTEMLETGMPDMSNDENPNEELNMDREESKTAGSKDEL